MVGARNDCTVRALANAFNTDYTTAHNFMASNGRRWNRRFKFSDAAYQAVDLIGQALEPTKWEAVSAFITGQGGSWVIRIRGHVFAVRDGVMYDLIGVKPLTPSTKVTGLWKVRNSERRSSHEQTQA